MLVAIFSTGKPEHNEQDLLHSERKLAHGLEF